MQCPNLSSHLLLGYTRGANAFQGEYDFEQKAYIAYSVTWGQWVLGIGHNKTLWTWYCTSANCCRLCRFYVLHSETWNKGMGTTGPMLHTTGPTFYKSNNAGHWSDADTYRRIVAEHRCVYSHYRAVCTPAQLCGGSFSTLSYPAYVNVIICVDWLYQNQDSTLPSQDTGYNVDQGQSRLSPNWSNGHNLTWMAPTMWIPMWIRMIQWYANIDDINLLIMRNNIIIPIATSYYDFDIGQRRKVVVFQTISWKIFLNCNAYTVFLFEVFWDLIIGL